ncbi:uncharacterized protein LOC107366147 isoform X2 [Tetranychus urticae]|uniref:NR LBD domain-containing protein n=1 Tax=Tetranychus urticae TaxID=32264 RepID=T1KPU4_TETUR|nr:uncharacterized protein LOC107366147 isoform X2 [Tetranychus urticae]
MEFYEHLSQFVPSVTQNEVLFSSQKLIDVETSILLPSISPVSIDTVFSLDNAQTPVNQKSNEMESFSLKKERMLEHGQIKIFTRAIDSYYNSNLDPDPPSLNSSTLNEMLMPTVACNRPIDDSNSTVTKNIESSSPTVSLTRQYLISPENRVTRISDKCKPRDQENCLKNKIWNSNVGKKILAVNFSPMSIKSEFLSKETALDGFESFALQEAVSALHEIVRLKRAQGEGDLNESRANLYADPLPVELVRSCQKSRAFRKLTLHDKIILLKDAFLDLNAMKNVTTYDATIDGWLFGGKICSRKLMYTANPNLLKKAVYFMDSFPVRFKSDFNVVALLFLVIIFNADLPRLRFKNTIKSEQYVYIYLLQRYLISSVQSHCEALEYFYQLMTIVEEIKVLKRATEQDFDSIRSDGSDCLKNRVVRLIELESIRW